MRHIGISGGGTKIGGLFGAAEVLIKEQNYQPDIISGISAGAILSLPLALGKFDTIREIVLNLKLDTFFNRKPVNKKGNISFGGIINFILGKTYLGRQDNLKKVLSQVVSEEEYKTYQKGKYPICLIGSVDYFTGAREYKNLKDPKVSYSQFLQYVNASGSIPVFTPAEEINNKYLYDGGLRDHIATPWVLENFDIQETISIYSRPEDLQIPKETKPKNVLEVLERTIDIMNAEISKNDELLEDTICKDRQILQSKFFLPRIMESVYDVDPERLKENYLAGREMVLKNSVKNFSLPDN
ncbi:patatin-like phospholipase family protein [Xanthovirga aplysinae]|uniref:patatin-like phospholipase family protein n=1 Tax=Xanthovirga aplysinae TaxID=2529853 RepID=UPI0012BBE537|nr:patatin-like phospholipase family protein [Xanthovirga aplysinae]MTI29871.1 patatin-like phospholipase family protein [Xanthovirga aplysinae]